MGKKLCTPVVIYIVLCIVGVIGQIIVNLVKDGNIHLAILLSHIGINILFGGLMFILCKVGLVGLSWVILLIPIIMTVITILIFSGGLLLLSNIKNKNHQKEVKEHFLYEDIQRLINHFRH